MRADLALTAADIDRAAARVEVEPAAIRALLAVESAGSGFLGRTDLPKILFEGHVFSRETGGRHDAAHPAISYPRWTKTYYRGGRGEYDRLVEAMRLDEVAALRSTSWGLGQVMGFNHAACGYGDVFAFVDAMGLGEAAQLDALVAFIAGDRAMAAALRSEDWSGFARRYNGPGYRANAYDVRLAKAFRGWCADTDGGRAIVAELQAVLNIVDAAGLAVDGWWGPRTEAAARVALSRQDGPVPADLTAAAALDRLRRAWEG